MIGCVPTKHIFFHSSRCFPCKQCQGKFKISETSCSPTAGARAAQRKEEGLLPAGLISTVIVIMRLSPVSQLLLVLLSVLALTRAQTTTQTSADTTTTEPATTQTSADTTTTEPATTQTSADTTTTEPATTQTSADTTTTEPATTQTSADTTTTEPATTQTSADTTTTEPATTQTIETSTTETTTTLPETTTTETTTAETTTAETTAETTTEETTTAETTTTETTTEETTTAETTTEETTTEETTTAETTTTETTTEETTTTETTTEETTTAETTTEETTTAETTTETTAEPTTTVIPAPAIFYPFGPAAGDGEQFENGGETSVNFTFSTPFTYFGRKYNYIYVNNNGLLTFSQPIPEANPFIIPYGVEDFIAALWTELDDIGLGKYWYQQYTSGSVLTRASQDINQYFPHIGFAASSVFVATWDYVQTFDTNVFNQRSAPTITFQAVLISGGGFSFILLNYGDCADVVPYPVEAGYDTINSADYYVIHYANDGYSISNLKNRSNVDVPGRWAFLVNNGTENVLGVQIKLSSFLDLTQKGNIEDVLKQIKHVLVQNNVSSFFEMKLRNVKKTYP
ncbi:uncharacterized protein LOC125255596 [Megalobrama amblycephala]|uniref:uncharacterized protein LOC125255596 n=1 Tax=Megalobrama amblycephala TaxID=75352 RepID=UPI002013D61F|nr:uncharacterized protein LOC125255596 [Megalobrama amblycephala]